MIEDTLTFELIYGTSRHIYQEMLDSGYKPKISENLIQQCLDTMTVYRLPAPSDEANTEAKFDIQIELTHDIAVIYKRCFQFIRDMAKFMFKHDWVTACNVLLRPYSFDSTNDYHYRLCGEYLISYALIYDEYTDCPVERVLYTHKPNITKLKGQRLLDAYSEFRTKVPTDRVLRDLSQDELFKAFLFGWNTGIERRVLLYYYNETMSYLKERIQ